MKHVLLSLILFVNLVQSNQVTNYIWYDLAEFNNPPKLAELWNFDSLQQLIKWLKFNQITISADLKKRILSLYGVASILGKPFGLTITIGKNKSLSPLTLSSKGLTLL